MKKILLFIIGVVSLNSFALENTKKVFINQLVQHPALNSTTKGIIDGLEQNGYKQGVNLDLRVESAQSNSALAAQIAAKFVNAKPDVVVGVATIAAQSFAKYAKENKVKLVFSSVTDPLKAELINSWEKPGNNSSGVSNFVEIEPQLKLFKEIQPQLKRLGLLYNPSEINSLSLITKLEEICPKFGINLILQTVNRTADIGQAITKLLQKSDAIFISNDSTALSAMNVIIQACNKVKIPVYVSDTDIVEMGALAALGPNQYNIGIQTAKIIARSLNGEDLNTIAIELPADTEIFLNEQAADKLGINFNNELRNTATKIIKK